MMRAVRTILCALALAGCVTPPLSPQEQAAHFGPVPDPPSAEQLAAAPLEVGYFWRQRPSAVDYVTVWPRNAWEAEVEGTVVLDCIIQADGRAICAARDDGLPAYDFEQAARNLSTQFRLDTIGREGTSIVGHRIQVSIAFRFH